MMSLFYKVCDRRKNKLKCIAFFVFILCTGSILILNYCSRLTYAWNGFTKEETKISELINTKTHSPVVTYNNFKIYNFTSHDLNKKYSFNAKKDVFVVLHIQKTGGSTFAKHLVNNSNFTDAKCKCFPNQKRCKCRTKDGFQWLFSRYSTGWSCGLHADWTELTACAPNFLNHKDGFNRNRRYLYMTILREPISRYISEWRHVQRGSTWGGATLKCAGRKATRQEIPQCYKGKDWRNVSFDSFTSCPYNMAHNRQTRMTSDLTLIGCYEKSIIPDDITRDSIMLQSAMLNLRSMSFFGLTEYQSDTQFLFEYTFGLKFLHNFTQSMETHASRTDLNSSKIKTIYQLNHLDLKLYAYAKELFLQRVGYARMKEKQRLESISSGKEVDEIEKEVLKEVNKDEALTYTMRHVIKEDEKPDNGGIYESEEDDVNRNDGGTVGGGDGLKVGDEYDDDRLLSGTVVSDHLVSNPSIQTHDYKINKLFHTRVSKLSKKSSLY